jgi:hypothetical protein
LVCLVFTSDHLSDDGLFSAVEPVLRGSFKIARIGTGTDAIFAELNRNWPDPEGPDYISWSVNPQVHAFDPLSLVENLEGQQDTILSGAKMAGGDEYPAILGAGRTYHRRLSERGRSVEGTDRCFPD